MIVSWPLLPSAAAAAAPVPAAYGTATVDGRLTPGEWERAARIDLRASVPSTEGGGKVPATLFVMNDAANLYLALRVGRVLGITGFWVEFNNNDDGTLTHENGDDAVGATLGPSGLTFDDYSRIWCTPPDLGRGAWCAPPDDRTAPEYPLAGTIDGRAAASQPDGMAVLELVHPLDSGDARDFNLHAGSTVGFQLTIQLVSRTGGVACTEHFDTCSTTTWMSGRMAIASSAATGTDPGPSAIAAVSPLPNAVGWLATDATVRITGAPGTTSITYWASTPALTGRGTNVGGSPLQPVTVVGSSASIQVSAEGTTSVHFFATPANGPTGPWQTVPVRIDRVAPALSGAYLSFVSPSTLGVGAGSSRVRWAGVDALAGIVRYELQESKAGAAWVAVASAGPALTQVARRLTIGTVYRYRVRAVDAAGNTSAWAVGPAYRIGVVDSGDRQINLTGRWRTATSATSVGGGTVYATSPGASARLTFYGSAVAWVAPTGGERGLAIVSIDGVPAVRQTAERPKAAARVVYGASWSMAGRHTIEIRVEGTPGRPRIDVDAFLVISPAPDAPVASTSLEAEALPVFGIAAEPAPRSQGSGPSGAESWSGGRQLLWPASGPGWLWLDVPFGQAGRYRVVLYGTKGPDCGQVQVQAGSAWDAHDVGIVDLFAPDVTPTGPIPLGVFHARVPGIDHLGVRVTGRNPASSGYAVGLDRIVLIPTP